MPPSSHLPHFSTFLKPNPIFFITTCTYQRKPILANLSNAAILIEEWRCAGSRHGWLIGRYVIMPDHVHFFCSSDPHSDRPNKNDLSKFIQQWKQWTSKRIIRKVSTEQPKYDAPIWQAEYFDHLLRSEESYDQKWEYVRDNPVRKNLVQFADEWPWQGVIFDLRI